MNQVNMAKRIQQSVAERNFSRSSEPDQSPDRLQMKFVNYDLSAEDKQALKSAAIDAVDLFVNIGRLVGEGYKLSFGWDHYTDSFAAWLIGSSKECVNYGFILSARASTVEKAIAALFYKHTSVFDGVWHDRVERSKPDDDF